MKESTESLSFLRVFLKKKSCHPWNSTLRPFFCKTNAAIAFGRPKNLRLEVFVTNRASTSRQTTRRTTTRCHAQSPEVRGWRRPVSSHLSCHVSLPANHLPPRVKNTHYPGMSSHRQVSHHIPATCHPVPRHYPVNQNFQKLQICPKTFSKLQICPETFWNYKITPQLSKFAELPLYFLKLLLFFLELQFYPYWKLWFFLRNPFFY